MRWTQFRQQQPDLAHAGARLLAERHGYSYLATLTRRGDPRIHPVAPFLIDCGLFLAVRRQSPKFADLSREPRLALHAAVSPPTDEEFATAATVWSSTTRSNGH